MNWKIVPLSLILTIFLLPTAQFLNAQETNIEEIQPIDIAVLESIRDNAHERQTEIQHLLPGESSPEVMNSLRHAQQAMEQAEAFLDTNPRAAAQQYLRAMNHWRNAFRRYTGAQPETLEDTDEAGKGITKVNPEEITEARELLLNRFQERYREQITQMMKNVDQLQADMSPDDALKAQEALRHAFDKLVRIQARITNGQYDEAVDELGEASETLDNEFDEVSDIGTALMLKTMNNFEAKIQKMEEKASRRMAAGLETSLEEEAIEKLRGNVDELKNDFHENHNKNSEQGNNSGQGSGSGSGSGSGLSSGPGSSQG